MELRGLLDPDLAPALTPPRLPLAPWLAALAGLTLLRLLVCATAPLSPDECYYWVWSRALAPGYLDHPPMVALWIRAGTWLAGDGPLGVRLLSPLSAALGTLLLGMAAADCGDGAGRRLRAVAAGVLLNATLVLGVGSVTMTPDTPLLFFWTLALAAVLRAVATGRGSWWLLAGLGLGLALDSKYTALLPAAGLAAWLLATRAGRGWLRRPAPWLAALLSLLLVLPMLAWNAAHGWASLVKQGGRTGDWHPGQAGRYLAELALGQIGLATPGVFALLALGLAGAARLGRRGDLPAALLAWTTLLPLAVFVQHATGGRVQANWPGLLYPGAALAAAATPPRRWAPAAALGLVLALPIYVQATLAPWPLPRTLDVTLQRLAGWPALAQAAAAATPGFVAADEYGLAAELAHTLPEREVLGVEPRWRLFRLPPPRPDVMDGLLIRSERRHDAPDPRPWASLVPAGELVRGRDGQVAERYRLYRVTLRPDQAGGIVRLP